MNGEQFYLIQKLSGPTHSKPSVSSSQQHDDKP